jgi:hypothetical protein
MNEPLNFLTVFRAAALGIGSFASLAVMGGFFLGFLGQRGDFIALASWLASLLLASSGFMQRRVRLTM